MWRTEVYPQAVVIQSSKDQLLAQGLRKMRGAATAMLALAAVVFLLTLRMGDQSWVGYVRAMAEAAMVGGLADWFAVTALFKHPLGIPIPHTAIVQKRKDEIGLSLGQFVRDNFLNQQTVTERIEELRLGEKLAYWLSDPANASQITQHSLSLVATATEMVDDEQMQQNLESLLRSRIEDLQVTPLVAKVVDIAVKGDHHQNLLDSVLEGLGRFMEDNRATFRQRLTQESPWWVPEPIDDAVFDKIYTGVRRFLSDVSQDPNHIMRSDIDTRAQSLADRMAKSPELAARGESIKHELLDNPELNAWLGQLWGKLKSGIQDAGEDPDLQERMQKALVEVGLSLRSDPVQMAKVEDWICATVANVIERFGSEVVDLIATTVQGWDPKETTQRMELQVGRDLQFIRINGTLVGGVAGLVIHAVAELL